MVAKGSSEHGAAGRRNSQSPVQFWASTERPDRASGKPNHGWQSASRQHHGSETDREYRTIWDVYEHGESHRAGGNDRRTGGANANAVHAGRRRAMGPWFSDGLDRGYASTNQFVKMRVRLGRGNQHRRARPIHGSGPVTPIRLAS